MTRVQIFLLSPVILVLLLACSGCSTVRISDPIATATQQYMTSEAIAKAIAQLSFDTLRGRRVFVDSSYLSESEKGFATAEFRAAVLQAGAYIQAERDNAEMVVEVRSNGIGIDRYQSLVGLPAIYGPPVGSEAAGAGAITQTVVTPEIALTKHIKQVGFASLSYVAYWADTGEIVAESGPFVGKTLRKDWWYFGFGPRTVGNVPVVDTTLR